jgi:hypothetical protein
LEWSFLANLLFHFGMGIFAIVTQKYAAFFLIWQGLIPESLSWVSGKILDLDFWTMLELLRLWEFLERDWMSFALWDRHEPFQGQG